MGELIWFNDQGDALNISKDINTGIYNATLNFDENSSDTFKTIGLYLFEKVEPIELDSNDNDLNLQKFQLFNENRLTFFGNSYLTESVNKIESVNNNSLFYSKWIYGNNFESLYPVGTNILFNQTVNDINNLKTTYTVVASKKNAIMIITSTDNQTYNTLYASATFSNVTISGLNGIGFYDYRRGLLDQYSSWSEPSFYNQLYNNKKLTIIQPKHTQLTTIENYQINDNVYYNYNTDTEAYLNIGGNDLNVLLTLNTNLPTVYTGGININGYNISFDSSVPKIFKPGTQFVIDNSILNKNTITVGNINTFVGMVSSYYYATQSQVLWNNIIYQCIQGYTQNPTSSITPDNANYWTNNITFLPSYLQLNNEVILNTNIHLTSNKILYTQNFSTFVGTLANFAVNYANDFKKFNVDLYYDYKSQQLNANSIYASKYVTIDFMLGTQSITTVDRLLEKIVKTSEFLTASIDYNTCENIKYDVVVTDVDNYGIRVDINGLKYTEGVEFVYDGINVNMRRTIDRTLRNFSFNNFAKLQSLGIDLILDSNIYSEFDFFKDTLIFKTVYPNVPFNMNITMGTNANFYVKHSKIIFNDSGNYINININGVDYGQKVTLISGVPDINTAITDWANTYYNKLLGYGIIVHNTRNILYFNLINTNTHINYTIRVGKLITPGSEAYVIENYIKGKLGTFITGNQLVLAATSSQSFEDYQFSTGMIVSVNNTVFPYDNQEYNIVYLDSNKMGLSYQGPFWDTYGKQCNVSAFTTLAFSPLAYYEEPCPVISLTSGGGGSFDTQGFGPGFEITYVYINSYDYISIAIPTDRINDGIYVNEYENIYVFGKYLCVIDANELILKSTITLPNGNPIKIAYNSYNKYIYALNDVALIIIDPNNNTVVGTPITMTATDILINQLNGDVYVSVNASNTVYVYKYTDYTSYSYTINIPNAGKMVYNIVDNNIYILGDKLYNINSNTRLIQNNYDVTDIFNDYIYVEPIYGYVYVFGDILYKLNNDTLTPLAVNVDLHNKILFDNFTGDLFISQGNSSNFTRVSVDDTVTYQQNFDYGDILVGQYDSDIYMCSNNKIHILDAESGYVKTTLTMPNSAKKIIYNPLRDSVIALETAGFLYEITVTLNSQITLSGTMSSPESVSDGLFGALSFNYTPKEVIWLKSREYLRKPRENYSDDITAQYVYSFTDDQTPEIFMFDISGEQLTTGTSFSYIGDKPLANPTLKTTPNADISKIKDPSAQQTIFSEIVNTLSYLNSSNDLSISPEPLQLFLGFNSTQEGYVKTKLNMYRRENVSFTISYDYILNNDMFLTDYGTYGVIQMNNMSSESFVYASDERKRGFKAGQLFKIEIYDITNNTNKYISYNNGKTFKLRAIYNTQLIVDYMTDNYGVTMSLHDENTIIQGYPKFNDNTYLKIKFTVVDQPIASINIFGQTEIEDIRYKIELNNTGHNVNPEDVYIFKHYNINEQGIDWNFLNNKRKELLIVRHDIFEYIGSYKAIINAISYFGYNDLELYEYYRNVDATSLNFLKLFKVEINDIFNNSVVGFTFNDFLKYTMPNPKFEQTNMFNLSYRITDKQGNNILLYSLPEVIIKLQGLKKWLESKVIPITHKILDITGRSDISSGYYMSHKMYGVKSFKHIETMTPIDLKINEAYLMPVNSNSTVYNVVIDFTSQKNATIPSDFSFNIKTYKTFKEWDPFVLYNTGDSVTYYGVIYTSAINNNKILDPRKYSNVNSWNANTEYFNGELVNYNRHIYEFLGTQSSFITLGTQSIITPAQTNHWLDISEWIIKDLEHVQNITQYRYGITYSTTTSSNNNELFYTTSNTHDYLYLSSYNFTIDSNIDPYISISVNSDNGYGLNYTTTKNYEIRGTNYLQSANTNYDSIGPFIPITTVNNLL